MRTLIQDIEVNSVKEAEEILKSAGTEDLFEKAHQDGDLHPTRPWIWVSSANKGKGDWRMNKNHKPNTPQELDERIKKMEEKNKGKSSSHENTKNGDDGKITLSESKKAAIKQGISYIKGKFYSGRGDEMEPVLYNGNIRFQKYQRHSKED